MERVAYVAPLHCGRTELEKLCFMTPKPHAYLPHTLLFILALETMVSAVCHQNVFTVKVKKGVFLLYVYFFNIIEITHSGKTDIGKKLNA